MISRCWTLQHCQDKDDKDEEDEEEKKKAEEAAKAQEEEQEKDKEAEESSIITMLEELVSFWLNWGCEFFLGESDRLTYL